MKRILALIMALCMLLTAAPAAFAEEALPVTDSGAVTEGVEPEQAELSGYTEYSISVAELLAQNRPKGRAALPSWYGDRLSGETRMYYDLLLQYFQRVHQNSGELSYFKLEGMLNNLTPDKSFAALHAMLADHPELLYWMEKGENATITALISSTRPQTSILILPVVTEYRGMEAPLTVDVTDESGHKKPVTYPAWVVVPNRGGQDAQALAKAAELVQTAAALPTDYEKIKFFNQQICSLTSYNLDAIKPNAPYDGAFQMFDVFLGNPVVCEGYAKAFKYLCDQSGVPCLTVTGTAVAGNQGGRHMWNYVQLGGKWYLVDVTNNDGAPDPEWLLAIGSRSPGALAIRFIPDSIEIGDGIEVPFDVVLSTAAYNPSGSNEEEPGSTGSTGSSGSSGGGGGGGGGSKGGGGGGASNFSASVSSATAASQMEKAVKTAVDAALKNGKANASAQVTVTNTRAVSAATLKAIADKAKKAGAGKNVAVKPVLASKTVRNGKTESVLYIDPTQATLTADIKLGVSLSDKTAEAAFKKNIAGKAAAVKFAQKGSFGMQVEAAVQIDLSKLDKDSLVFYTYDPVSKSFSPLAQPSYSVDKNGFVHFYVSAGGTVLITDRSSLKS